MSVTLYHVSYDLSEPLHKEFIPRIPNNTVNEEDESILRICFSDSIQGCIRAICGYPKTDSGYVDVIVWKHEFQSNDDLYDWKYLYSHNLVPDAAVTHEYWYTKKIVLDGVLYRISNIEHRILYSFQLKYKKNILQILSNYIDNLSIFDNIDLCTIINEWLPRNLPLVEEEIIEQMKDELAYDEEKEENEQQYAEVFREIFGDTPKEVNRIPDYDYTDMLTSCRVFRL